MDIEYLLWLQNLREASDGILTPFMVWVSDYFAEIGLLIVPFFVYWCLSKRGGIFLLLSMTIGQFLCNVIKMTCCVYRPFIRDSRLVPYGHRPSGFSFPSGHTMTAAPILGGLAALSREKYMHPSRLSVFLLWLVCPLMIFAVMFSRNYLGAHTPQDVIVGLILSVIILYAVSAVMSHPEHENTFAFLGILMVIAGVAYVTLKPYHIDLDADGKPLVNVSKMINGVYLYGGSLTGVIAGRLIEKKYIRFTPTGLNVKGIILTVIGYVIYVFMNQMRGNSAKFLAPLFTKWGGTFVHTFVMMLFVTAIWPCVIKKFSGKMTRENEDHGH